METTRQETQQTPMVANAVEQALNLYSRERKKQNVEKAREQKSIDETVSLNGSDEILNRGV